MNRRVWMIRKYTVFSPGCHRAGVVWNVVMCTLLHSLLC